MEAEEARRIMRRISGCRAHLLSQYPFYGTLVMQMPVGLQEGCGTAWTDMRRIVFDPAFAGRLSDTELEFVLQHEVMHCALRHCVRGKGFHQRLFNIACDIVVNSNILDSRGLKEIQVDGVSAMHLTPDGDEGYRYTAEDVYRMLLEKGAQDSLLLQPLIDSHEYWDEIEDREAADDAWAAAVKGICGKEAGRMKLPQAARKLRKGYEEASRLRWKELLRDFILETGEQEDYSFLPPERRLTDWPFILPGLNTVPEEEIRDLWFCVDTSGSISQRQLEMIMNEIAHAVRQTGFLQGKISFFDTTVTAPVSFTDARDIGKMIPAGGGGTSFYCIFEYLKANMLRREVPRAMIIMTDGYAPFPPEQEAMGIPVLWLIFGTDVRPPWGKFCRYVMVNTQDM